FFFTLPAPAQLPTLSLPDALPISSTRRPCDELRARPSAHRLTVATALLVGFLLLVVDLATEQADPGANGRAHSGITGHGADRGATRRADDRAGAGAPLRVGHLSARGERQRKDESERHDSDHVAPPSVTSGGTGTR